VECPLEAALAAKNHGFKFADKDGDELFLVQEMSGRHVFQKWINDFYEGKQYRKMADYYGKYYIAPKILKTIDDDLIETGDHKFLLVAPEQYVKKYPLTMITKECADWTIEEDCAHIIRRGDFSFPTIKYEDVA
jgi:hypothetical protein